MKHSPFEFARLENPHQISTKERGRFGNYIPFGGTSSDPLILVGPDCINIAILFS